MCCLPRPDWSVWAKPCCLGSTCFPQRSQGRRPSGPPHRGSGNAGGRARGPHNGVGVSSTTGGRELAAEGRARDGIRVVQQARREAGLDVSDRISLTVSGDDDVWAATVAHQQLIMMETLAMQFGSAGSAHPLPAHQGVDAVVGDNQPIRILVETI